MKDTIKPTTIPLCGNGRFKINSSFVCSDERAKELGFDGELLRAEMDLAGRFAVGVRILFDEGDDPFSDGRLERAEKLLAEVIKDRQDMQARLNAALERLARKDAPLLRATRR